MSNYVLTPALSTQRSPHFISTRIGALRGLERYSLFISRFNQSLPGKVFLKDALGLTSMEVSITELAPGISTPILHRHKQHEELYLFISGRGQMQIDGELFDVEEGSAVGVAPDGVRAIRAAADQSLVFLCIQARRGTVAIDEAHVDGVPEGRPEWPK